MSEEHHDSPQLDRRALLSAAAGLAASVTALPALSAETERALQLAAAGRGKSAGRRTRVPYPYDSFRDWI